MLHSAELRSTLWAKLHPSELSCTLLSYAASFWATLHPSELRCTLSKLRCALRTTLLPLDKLEPSELCYSLLSYAASFWATLYTTELRLALNELRGTLKNIMHSARRSFADPYTAKLMICRENPAKCPSLAKNPPKYTTAYIVQQSNCRWQCEPTFFLGWAFNKEKSIHTLPLQSLHLLSYLYCI